MRRTWATLVLLLAIARAGLGLPAGVHMQGADGLVVVRSLR